MAKEDFRIELIGAEELQRLMSELPKRVVKKALRQALNAAASPIVKAIKQSIAKEDGFLKKSIKKKIKTYPNGNVAAVIGADKAVRGQKLDLGKGTGTKIRQGKLKVPSRYFHLVEMGHGGPHPAAPHPALKPAYEAHRDEANKIVAAKLAAVVEAEALKLGKK